MLQLTGTSDLLRVVTSAAADVEPHVAYVENNAGTVTPGRTNTASIVTGTTTTILGSPAASRQYRVKFVSLRNNHASVSCDVTVTHEDGTSVETIIKATLLPGEVLVMDEQAEWHHYDANGGEYRLEHIFADRDHMEGGISLATLVSPGNQHFHPGMPKAWAKCGVTGNLLASYNVTSVTDTGAGRATFVIATDFAFGSYAAVTSVQRTNTNSAVTDWKTAVIRFGTMLVTSFENEVYDFTATTAVQEDPTAHHMLAIGQLV